MPVNPAELQGSLPSPASRDPKTTALLQISLPEQSKAPAEAGAPAPQQLVWAAALDTLPSIGKECIPTAIKLGDSQVSLGAYPTAQRLEEL